MVVLSNESSRLDRSGSTDAACGKVIAKQSPVAATMAALSRLGPKIHVRRAGAFFVVGALALVTASPAHAFKPKGHITIANLARASLKNESEDYKSAMVSVSGAGDLAVDNAEVAKAVSLCPEHFRAGSMGPDIFPDLVEGQLYTHVNQGRVKRCSEACIASHGANCEPQGADKDCQLSNVVLESRPLDHWRPVDYAMYQMKQALQYNPAAGSDPCTPHLQAIAFSWGYMSHVIGDGFAHTYVNEWSRSVFDMFSGGGIFGPITEELQHLAIEGYMESHVNTAPADVAVAWPSDFLYQLYTTKVTGTEVAAATGADAGAFGGPFPVNVVKIRDIFDTLGDHHKWADILPGPTTVNAAVLEMDELISKVATLGTGIGSPIVDIEQFFQGRKEMMVSLLKHWPDLSGCVGQNLAAGSVQPLGQPLRQDRCASIDFESDPGMKELFRGTLNEAAWFGADEGEDFNFGKTENNVRKLMNYMTVLAARALVPKLPDDIASLNKIKNLVLSFCKEKGVLGNATCTDACTAAQQVCQKALKEGQEAICDGLGCHLEECNCESDFLSASCLLYGDCWNCTSSWCYAETFVRLECATNCQGDSNWIIKQSCIDAINAATGICTFCTENGVCTMYDEFNALQEKVDAFIADILQPYLDAAVHEIKMKLLEYYAGPYAQDYVDLWDELKSNKAAATPAWFVNIAFLKEDLGDPAYVDQLLQRMTGLPGPLLSNAASLAEAINETNARTHKAGKEYLRIYLSFYTGEAEEWLWDKFCEILVRMSRGDFDLFKDLASDAYKYLDEFSFKTSDQTYKTRWGRFVALLTELNAMIEMRGPTVQALRAELKLPPEEPGTVAALDLDHMHLYHNSIELTKLSLLGGTAITQLAGAPAAGASPKSKICTTVPNIVCDSVQSLDDPNNYGYPALTDGSPDWERSVAYWASRPRQWKNGTVTQDACVLAPTDFILADSEEKADRLYSKIFQYPDSCVSPRGMGLDDPSNPWTTDGPATVSPDPTTKTQGSGSLKVSGCGYTVIKSPTFNSTDFGLVSSSLALDVYIPAEQANQYWWGDVKMFASIPAAGVNNAYLGLVGFTGLPSNQWTTITFSVPDAVKTALLGDYPRVQFSIEIQQVSCAKPAFLDNLRFLPPATTRTVFHASGSSAVKVATNPLWSFETLGDWAGTGTSLRLDQTRKTDRASSLAATAGSWVTITSRQFATSETPGATNTLSVDVWVPARASGDTSEAWMHAYLSCPSANINNQYLGNKGLEQLFYDEFNSVTFPLTAAQRNALSTVRDDCAVTLAFNSATGRGEFLFDRMGFVP